MTQDLLGTASSSYSPPSHDDIQRWWTRVCDAARRSKLGMALPARYEAMQKL
jgi:hypothetical protein